MNIVLFGPPGSGKGTQSEMLIKELGMHQISTGDLFRENFKKETELGKKAKAYVDRGELVPDEITVGMVEDALNKTEGRDFILDGFPRSQAQAETLDKMLETRGVSVEKAIFLNVPTEVLVKRLCGRRIAKGSGAVYHVDFKPPQKEGVCDIDGSELYQRDDDKEEVIQTRLQTYNDNTAPLVDYYSQQGKYCEVDGNQDTAAVFAKIRELLSS